MKSLSHPILLIILTSITMQSRPWLHSLSVTWLYQYSSGSSWCHSLPLLNHSSLYRIWMMSFLGSKTFKATTFFPFQSKFLCLAFIKPHNLAPPLLLNFIFHYFPVSSLMNQQTCHNQSYHQALIYLNIKMALPFPSTYI